MKKQRFVLDSYALLAFFQAESGGEKTREILKKALAGKSEVFLSVINLGEIYYIIARKIGEATAKSTMEDISKLPLDLLEAGKKRVLHAASLKALYPVSYADVFAAASALEFSAVLVTGDPEFKALESRISILWLNSAS